MRKAGRHLGPTRKLTPDQERNIRASYWLGDITYLQLAAKWNVSRATIQRTLNPEYRQRALDAQLERAHKRNRPASDAQPAG